MCYGGSGVGSSVQNMLSSVTKFVRSLPNDCHRHIIVITFILRSKHQTNVQIEIKELDGGVKATGLLCLLGIGVGLGSYFVYRLYTRFFPKPVQQSARTRRPNSGELYYEKISTAACSTSGCDKTLAETPDSGISTDPGTTDNTGCGRRPIEIGRSISVSDPERHWHEIERGVTGSAFRKRSSKSVVEWLARAELAKSADHLLDAEIAGDVFSDRRRDDAPVRSSRSCRSSGFASIGRLTEDFHGTRQTLALFDHAGDDVPCRKTGIVVDDDDEDKMLDEPLSITDHVLVPSIDLENPEDNEFLEYSMPEGQDGGGRGFFSFGLRRRASSGSIICRDVPRQWLRRRRHRRYSASSEVSSASSGWTYRESLVSKGLSVDLGEDLTGIMTPPESDVGNLNDHWTVSSMDQLHKELQKIQDDISYMNEKVEILIAKDDPFELLSSDRQPAMSSGDVHRRRTSSRAAARNRRLSRSVSSSRSRSRSVDVGNSDYDDNNETPDFVWDYHSDLALNRYDRPVFVNDRPRSLDDGKMERATEERSENVPTSGNAKDASKLRTSRTPRGPTRHPCDPHGTDRRRVENFGDMYIDDEIGGIYGRDASLSSSHDGVFERSPPTNACDALLRLPRPALRSTHDSGVGPRSTFDGHFLGCPESRVCDGPRLACCSSSSPFSCRRSFETNGYCHACVHRMLFQRTTTSCFGCHGCRTARARPCSARTSGERDRPSARNRCETCRFEAKCENCGLTDVVREEQQGQGCPCVVLFDRTFDQNQIDPVVGQANDSFSAGERTTGRSSCPENCSLRNVERTTDTSRNSSIHGASATNGRNIGNKINVREYYERESNGCEKEAVRKKGYHLLNRLWGITAVRRINGDNYCSLRAIFYQAMIHNLPLVGVVGTFQNCVQKLAMAVDCGHSYLLNWTFGSRWNISSDLVVMKMTECLRMFFEQVEAMADMSSVNCREQYLIALLNHGHETDLHLLEAVKILMMLKVIDLFNVYRTAKNSSAFVLQLFAENSPRSLQSLFGDHINNIGDTAPLRQLELCLLGLTLGIRIEVVRPLYFNRENFVVHYPDEGADGFPKVRIVEEEDWVAYSTPAS